MLCTQGKYFAWKNGDLHTDLGTVKETDLVKAKDRVTTNTGVELHVFHPKFNDLLSKIKRGPQIMIPKDVGLLFSYTNIDRDSTVLEAGTGSGVTALHLARFVKKVITYEKRDEFFDIAKKNIEFFGFKNIVMNQKDVEEGLDEKELDLIVFDLAEPWRLVDKAYAALKEGCYVVAYLPSITQVMYFVKKAQEKFYVERVVEVLQREWHVEEKRVRPHSEMIAHTGFMCFVRKI